MCNIPTNKNDNKKANKKQKRELQTISKKSVRAKKRKLKKRN